jgi:hypothetical protein
MKINKNFVLVSLTALITATSTALITLTILQQKDETSYTGTASEPISWAEAQKLMTDYSNSAIMKTKYTESGTEKIEVLKGFVFDWDDINEIVRHNHSGIKPESIVFYLGQDGSFMDGSGKEWPIINLIAVGMENMKILSEGIAGQAPSIYDKADPCPPNCPK